MVLHNVPNWLVQITLFFELMIKANAVFSVTVFICPFFVVELECTLRLVKCFFSVPNGLFKQYYSFR